MKESSTQTTGAPTDLVGGMPATDGTRPATGAALATEADPLASLAADSRRRLAEIADRLIPQAHGMPAAAEVLNDDRLRFVLRSRPDLIEPLTGALRPEIGEEVEARLYALADDEPTLLAALQLVIVAGYYTDGRVRELIGYPGQLAIAVQPDEDPPYLAEGLVDAVLARGPVWRDPQTGRRAAGTQQAQTDGGANDGRDGA